MKTTGKKITAILILIIGFQSLGYSQDEKQEQDYSLLYFYLTNQFKHSIDIYINDSFIGSLTRKEPKLIYKIFSEGSISVTVRNINNPILAFFYGDNASNYFFYEKSSYQVSKGSTLYLKPYNNSGKIGLSLSNTTTGKYEYNSFKNNKEPLIVVEDINNPIIKEEWVIEEPEEVVTLESDEPETVSKPETEIDVDHSIPVTTTKKPATYALIIGNEDYSSFQTGLSSEVNVDYAINDARIFREYLIRTMGIPEKNILYLENGTSAQMKREIAKLSQLAQFHHGEAELVFYYSGHGLPDETSQEAYLIPVDVSGADLSTGIKLNDVYEQLCEFPAKRVTVFLDACFSGGARNQPLIAMRGVRVAPKENVLQGNLVVFSSSSGKESSGVYHEMQHGMFTYFLLKKLQESQGDITYRELSEYLHEHVGRESLLINDKLQFPQTLVSETVANEWQDWMFK